jgi:hypothetical protein
LALVARLRELEEVDAVAGRKAGARDRAAEPVAAAARITRRPIDRLVTKLNSMSKLPAPVALSSIN